MGGLSASTDEVTLIWPETYWTVIRGEDKVSLLPSSITYNYVYAQEATLCHWDKTMCHQWLCQVPFRRSAWLKGQGTTLAGGVWSKVRGLSYEWKKTGSCPLLCQSGSFTWLLTLNNHILLGWRKRKNSQTLDSESAIIVQQPSVVLVYLERVWYM